MIHKNSEEPIGDWRKIFQLTFPTSVVLGVKATRMSFFLINFHSLQSSAVSLEENWCPK